jgi:hypothetical protein
MKETSNTIPLHTLPIHLPQFQLIHLHPLERPDINRPMIREEIRISRFPAYTRSTDGAEGVRHLLLAEGIGRHVVLAGVPRDVGFEGVDHQVAVDVADGAIAGCYWAVFDWRGGFDGVSWEESGLVWRRRRGAFDWQERWKGKGGKHT